MKLGWIAPLALVLTACGGGDGGESAPAPSTPAGSPSSSATADAAAPLKSAVQAYSDAYLTGDADRAYALLSQRCQDRIGEATFSTVATAAGQQYGSAMPLKSFDADMNGEQARVTYTYDVAAINQADQPWVDEGGWKYDAC